MNTETRAVTVNGRSYAWPTAPLVVVCIDGSEPAYMEHALSGGHMPFLARTLAAGGADLRATAVMPSFTNPNNVSIVTGAPPCVHGICGNFFLDTDSGQEVMMNDPAYLRAPTILAAFQNLGARIAIVTAKDKLRRLLGHGLQFANGGAVCFSSEKADTVTVAQNGLADACAMIGGDPPPVYSAELSAGVFAAGVALMTRMRPQLTYLSTTDYIQHKHAPGTAAANLFYAMMDRYWEQLSDLGAILALTADHGMNAKHDDRGAPVVVYLQERLDTAFGGGATRVVLPITDPYVVHHGALGSCAMVYLAKTTDGAVVDREIAGIDGIDAVHDRDTAAAAFMLPADRIGDLMVIAARGAVLGTTAGGHDLSGLQDPLRSHGGVSECTVPLVFSRPVTGLDPAHRLRNFDVFDIALNHLVAP